jgi:diguanylate cyclase (GGDEF)-like protein
MEASIIINSTRNLDELLKIILQSAEKVMLAEASSVFLIDSEKNELYFEIATGPKEQEVKKIRLKMGEGIAGWVAKHGEPLLIPDVYTDPRFAKRVDQLTKWHTRSIICMPLCSKQRVLGVIQLVNVEMAGFGDSELLLMRAMADYAAIAIENARAVERIQELTITDDCTGLYNARHLYKTLDTEVNRSARFGYQFSVLFLDLDYFKRVNDTHGHLVGSRLLGEVGVVIKSYLRMIDCAFRYGGDEFVVLLPQTGKEAATLVAKRLLDIFRTTDFLKAEGLNLNVRVSMGVATYPEDAKNAHDIIHQADEMMYAVKNSTRDNISVAKVGLIA